VKLDIAVLSRVGGRARNEDACGYWTSDHAACCVVSDGAGGHGGGDVAARTVVAEIVREFSGGPQVSAQAITAFIRNANAVLRERQHSAPGLHDMRATVAVLAIDCRREFALWGHVGDTRVYGFRDHGVHFQSHDHSVLQRMIDAGYGDPSLLRSHPRRGVLLHALGGDDPVPPTPIAEQPQFLRDGDAFLLCTDGLWEYVSETRMVEERAAAADAAGWLAALEAEVRRTAGPGNDNYSAIAVLVAEVGDATRFDPL
jgi:serine/threonine protein phosphatase PrpC